MEPRSSGGRFLLLEPAMGFGPRRIVMAPAGFDAARLPRGVHAVEGVAVLSASPASSRRGTFVVGALPMGGHTTAAFLGAPSALDCAVAAADALYYHNMRPGTHIAVPAAVSGAHVGLTLSASRASSRRETSSFAAAGSSSRTGRRVVMASGAAFTNIYPSDALYHYNMRPGTHMAVPAAVSGAHFGLTLSASRASSRRGTSSFAAAGSSSRTGRRIVVASGAAHDNIYPSDESSRAAERMVLSYDNMRAGKHIAAWVHLARLKTTFEVAFDAGALESGRDLRKLLEVIGEIDPAARIHPWTVDTCLARLGAVIGHEKLKTLLSARTPESDNQFVWSAVTAEALILITQELMGTLYSVIIINEGWLRPMTPWCALYDSCPMLLRRLMRSVEEFSVIVESTKFRRPQSSIRFRILEDHALALEHLYATALDIYKEVCPTGSDEGEYEETAKALRNRRVTLFEQDMGLPDYMFSIGLSDSRSVIQCVDHICWVIRERILGPEVRSDIG